MKIASEYIAFLGMIMLAIVVLSRPRGVTAVGNAVGVNTARIIKSVS